MALQYSFLPAVRRGLARAYSQTDGAPGLLARPQVMAGLVLKAATHGAAAPDVQGSVPLRLYGPADVAGVDPRLIVRTEPRAGTSNFEPNYLAAIDFDPPDFPWMFTPAKADANKRLRPWLVLVVLDRAAGVAAPRMAGGPLPRISLTAAQAASELPRLSESSLWAHGQVVTNTGSADEIQATLQHAPAQTVSRLIAPRRLKPQSRYVACVVPAFEPGRTAGLGMAPAGDAESAVALDPAWADDPQARREIDLPVYFHWEFSTGPLGDFETLARRLLTPANYPSSLDPGLQQQLATLGTEPVRLDSDKVLTGGGPPVDVLFEGALVSLDLGTSRLPQADVPDAGVAARLADVVNEPQAMNLAKGPSERLPTVSPPVYGCWPANQYAVQPAQLNHNWLADLNLDPRYRLAAGYGAAVVRQQQELYMQSCWAQVGDVLAAQRALNAARLATELARNLITRNLAKLPPQRVLAVLGPARTRLAAAAGVTIQARIARTSLPDAAFDPALRRQFSPQRPALKAAASRAGLPPSSVAQQVQQLYAAMANASKNVGLIDPNRLTPDGILGTDLYDGVTLPGTGATIDLGPLLGIDRVEKLSDARKLKSDARTLSKNPPKPVAPDLASIRKQGFVTQDLQAQVALAAAQSGTTLSQADVLNALVSAAPKAGKGEQDVSITFTRGKSTIAVALAGRRAALAGTAASGAKPASAGKNVAALASSVAPATVSAPELSAAGRTKAGIAVGAMPAAAATGSTALFKFVPPLKDAAVMTAVTAAFPDYVDRVNQWKTPGLTIEPVDFAMPATATAALRDIDPLRTIAARVGSMLSVADQRLKFSGPGDFGIGVIATQRAKMVPGLSRYVIPVTLDRVMAYPSIPQAVSAPLSLAFPDAMLPGAQNIPNDFVLLVKTNPRFVESFMVGMNHEMARELLWRGYPTDQRGTPFRQFWDRIDGKPDIEPIDKWVRSAQIGGQGAADAEQNSWLVLVIRGELLQRFPNTIFYAQRKSARGPTLATLDEFPADQLICNPVFVGPLPTNITYVGFPIPPADRDQWCFVVEEHMTEPRFGFDEKDRQRAVPDASKPAGWKDVDWDQVGVAADGWFGLADLRRANPRVPESEQLSSTAHAAHVAHAMLQRPFRGFWLAADLQPRA